MPTLLRVRTKFIGGSGGNQINSLHFKANLIPDQAEADGVWTRVRAFWNSVRAHMVTTYQIILPTEVEVIDEDSGEVEALLPHAGETLVGSVTLDANPWQTQGLIRLRTNDVLNGRRVGGKIFIPGTPVANNSNGVPSGSYTGDLTTAGTALIGSGTNVLAVYHRPVPPSVGADPVGGLGFAVTAATALSKWVVLRSRRD